MFTENLLTHHELVKCLKIFFILFVRNLEISASSITGLRESSLFLLQKSARLHCVRTAVTNSAEMVFLFYHPGLDLLKSVQVLTFCFLMCVVSATCFSRVW